MRKTLSLLLVLTCSVISLTAASQGKAPSITKEPDSLSAGYGGTVKLSITTEGTEPLSFQWYKDGVVLNNDTVAVTGANTASLNLGPVKPIHGGEYFAVISNSFGSVTSQVARLSLLQDVPVKKTGAWAPGSFDMIVFGGMAIKGSFAYVATSGSSILTVLDISNPKAPQIIGGHNTGVAANGITMQDNYAYVAAGEAGLEIIDISNPANPKHAGSYVAGGYATSVSVKGHYAYVADVDLGMQVIDISNPANPIKVGGCKSYGLNIALKDNVAYLATGSDGLGIVDISNPENPLLIGSFKTGGDVFGADVAGNYLYLADWLSGLEVVDISNPTSPQHVGLFDTEGRANQVKVVGDYAFVADVDGGLQIINISHPEKPQSVGVYKGDNGNIWAVSVSGNYAYVFAEPTSLQVIDISNPANPQKVGESVRDLCNDMVVEGNFAYVADMANGFQILDVSNPANPFRVGGLRTSADAMGIAVSGNYAYIVEYSYASNEVFEIIDISNPANPQRVGSMFGPKGTIQIYFPYKIGVFIKGQYAYIGVPNGIQVIDISNPANPITVGNCGVGTARSITVIDNYLYSASGYSGLSVVDISNPSNPQKVGQYNGGNGMDGVVVGNYAYLANSYSGLDIVDIRNPASPQHVGVCKTGNRVNGVTVMGHYAYLASEGGGGAGVEIIDISNPSNPQKVGQDFASIESKSVAVQGDCVYVTTWFYGFTVFQLSGISPVIVQNPSSLLVRPGDQVTLNGWASGTQPISYQWTFNGAVLSGQTNASLLIRSFSTNQLGLYSLIASNTSGSVTSEAVLLAEAILPPEPFAGSDDFNDSARNPNYWGEPQNIVTGGSLIENNSRLELGGLTSIVLPFIGNKPSYSRNWEAITDVSIGYIPLNQMSSRVQMFLTVANPANLTFTNGISGDFFSVALDLYLDPNNLTSRSVKVYSAMNGTETTPSASIATTNLQASLRITFDGVTKTLTAYCDPNGSEDGYQWTALRSVVISPSDKDWQMSNDSTFQVFLGGSSTLWNVTTSDLVYADNFQLIEEENPLSLAIIRIGNVPQLTVTGLIGQQIDIEYSDSLANTSSWKILTSLTLTNTSQSVIDSTLNGTQTRYYRISLKH